MCVWKLRGSHSLVYFSLLSSILPPPLNFSSSLPSLPTFYLLSPSLSFILLFSLPPYFFLPISPSPFFFPPLLPDPQTFLFPSISYPLPYPSFSPSASLPIFSFLFLPLPFSFPLFCQTLKHSSSPRLFKVEYSPCHNINCTLDPRDTKKGKGKVISWFRGPILQRLIVALVERNVVVL